MVMTTTYNARAVHWEHGWELHVDGVGVTQVRVLADADQQIRHLIETLDPTFDASKAIVALTTDLAVEDDVADVRAMNERVQRESREVAARSRQLVRDLRRRGVSVSDAATLLGVSRGRISQLAKDRGPATAEIVVAGTPTSKTLAKTNVRRATVATRARRGRVDA